MNEMVRRTTLVLAGSVLCLAGCSQMRGRVAPELSAGEWMNTPDDRPVRLAEHRGAPVLVEFWATW